MERVESRRRVDLGNRVKFGGRVESRRRVELENRVKFGGREEVRKEGGVRK